MAQKTIEKKSRKKITVKPFTVEEKSILRKAFDQMRKNGVKFIKNGSSLTLSVQINGKTEGKLQTWVCRTIQHVADTARKPGDSLQEKVGT